MPDRIFAEPRLAAIYDEIDGDRRDLDLYESILDRVGARSVLDIARRKPGADLVTWVLGDASTLPPLTVDAVTMTGNVAQVFVNDDEWSAALNVAHAALREGGHLVFETRDPSYRAWEEWTREQSFSVTDTSAGRVEHWVELTEVALPFVSFRHSYRFIDSGDFLTSDSTLRFRNRDEIRASLGAAGFSIEEVRDAPDRPGREFVVISRSTPT